MSSHFAVRLARGPSWNAAVPLREQALWKEHGAFMDALTAEGFVVLGGPLEGSRGALLIIQADSEASLRARLAEDPWFGSGHLRIERIDAWTILLDSRSP